MHQLVADHLASVGFDEYQSLRDQLLDALGDRDLGTAFGGATLTLGALCRQMGEVEHAYVESFKTFRMDYEYRHPDKAVETRVAALRSWYGDLDQALMAALEALSEDDLERRIIRSDFDPGYYSPRPIGQLSNYREALLIFYGKASIYLQALDKPFSPQWQTWIG